MICYVVWSKVNLLASLSRQLSCIYLEKLLASGMCGGQFFSSLMPFVVWHGYFLMAHVHVVSGVIAGGGLLL